MVDEIKVEEIKKETPVDLINMFDSIEKVLSLQHGRVIKEFNENCRKSLRVVPIVTAMMTIENYKLLKEIRDLLSESKNAKIAEESKRKPIK